MLSASAAKPTFSFLRTAHIQPEKQRVLNVSITASPLNAGNIGAMLLVIRESFSGPSTLRSTERKWNLSMNFNSVQFYFIYIALIHTHD